MKVCVDEVKAVSGLPLRLVGHEDLVGPRHRFEARGEVQRQQRQLALF